MAFNLSLPTFVREVIQNANDQRLGDPEVHFRFHELSGDELQGFLDAIRWDELSAHLEAAARAVKDQNQVERLEDLINNERLLILTIEDRNTVGLTGDEFEGDSHFRALCKDTLFSHKQSDSAGGSYGLGKSVLWAFSAFKTVLFLSNLVSESSGQQSPRLIGRAELPSHGVGTNGFSGPGWFGRPVAIDRRTRAESIWAGDAHRLAGPLKLARSPTFGTSILIVGFRDPTGEADSEPSKLADDLRTAATEWFWPTLAMPARPLSIWVAAESGRPVGDSDLGDFRPFFDAYRGRESTKQELESPGDVVVRDIEVELPARRSSSRKTKGLVRLCVRLAGETEGSKNAGRLAMFRGPGMVVKYRDLRATALGARPFHAVLACGEARAPGASSDADREIEAFMRAAEPPGHDDWRSTARLKNEYKQGYAKALQKLDSDVKSALRDIVMPRPRQGERGPDLLAKRFPFGKWGSEGGGPTIFHFTGLSAVLEGDRWRVRGEVAPSSATETWSCSIRLVNVGEDGRDLADVPLETLRTEQPCDQCIVERGVGRIASASRQRAMTFEGCSVPVDRHRAGELALEIRATRGV